MALKRGLTDISKVYRGTTEVQSIYRGTSLIWSNFDADALAFVTAAGITDNTQKTAIDTLVKGLKTNNLWTKMKAIYPFVGGTATTHKFNLKDPRDLDAAFRLQFFGGITHSANGVLPNGTNGYADTFFVPSIQTTLNSEHLSLYSTTNNTPLTIDSVDIGSYVGSTLSSILAIRGFSSKNTFFTRLNGNIISFTNIDARGLFIASKTSATLTKLYKNSTNVASGNSGGILSSFNIFIGTIGRNIPYSNGWTNQNYAFATIGDGITDTDATNFYNIVQAYQTTLGRQV